MLRINKVLILCILSTLSFSAFALKDDSTKPIQIEADNATADQKNMVTVFTGDVVMTRGSIIVHANQATANQDAGGNKTVHVTGSPVTFEQTNDDGEKTEGQCNDFVYSTKTDVAILTGRARVKKGDNEVMGDRLTYNTKTQVYSASSANANGVNSTKSGRVTVILQPNQKGQSNDQF